MKRFLIILLAIMMMTSMALAAGVQSPTPEKMIKCIPELEWCFAVETENWENISEWLEDFDNLNDEYILLEALYVTLDKKYDEVKWSLMIPVFQEYEPFILIIDEETLVKQEVKTSFGWVVTDFTDLEPGSYYICFYIKGTD